MQAREPQYQRKESDTFLNLREGLILCEHYRLIEFIGQGAMGVVWLAEDTSLDIQRALKFVPPTLAHDKKVVRQLDSEAKKVARLDNPNIVSVHALEQHGDFRFVVFDYVSGWRRNGERFHTLEDLIDREGALGEKRARLLLAPILEALHYAHTFSDSKVPNGIAHLDIKPSNILLDAEGQPKVTDFGIAECIQSSWTGKTGMEPTGGTPLYMSPEAHRGSATLDARSDIYSLGIMIYEMLTGAPPFTRGNITHQHINEPVPLIDGVSEKMNTLIQGAVEKDPGDRCQSCKDMLAVIGAEAGRIVDPSPERMPEAGMPGPPSDSERVLRLRGDSGSATLAKPPHRAKRDKAQTDWLDPLQESDWTETVEWRIVLWIGSLFAPFLFIARYEDILRQHIDERIESTQTQSPKFQNKEGRAILTRLERAKGRPRRQRCWFTPLCILAAAVLLPYLFPFMTSHAVLRGDGAIVYYTAVLGSYLLWHYFLLMRLLFRFCKHRKVEAVLQSYVTNNPDTLTALLPGVRKANRILTTLSVILGLAAQSCFLLFGLIVPSVWRHHRDWEKATSIDTLDG